MMKNLSSCSRPFRKNFSVDIILQKTFFDFAVDLLPCLFLFFQFAVPSPPKPLHHFSFKERRLFAITVIKFRVKAPIDQLKVNVFSIRSEIPTIDFIGPDIICE